MGGEIGAIGLEISDASDFDSFSGKMKRYEEDFIEKIQGLEKSN